jgi:hypothetical protein
MKGISMLLTYSIFLNVGLALQFKPKMKADIGAKAFIQKRPIVHNSNDLQRLPKSIFYVSILSTPAAVHASAQEALALLHGQQEHSDPVLHFITSYFFNS